MSNPDWYTNAMGLTPEQLMAGSGLATAREAWDEQVTAPPSILDQATNIAKQAWDSWVAQPLIGVGAAQPTSTGVDSSGQTTPATLGGSPQQRADATATTAALPGNQVAAVNIFQVWLADLGAKASLFLGFTVNPTEVLVFLAVLIILVFRLVLK